MHLCKPVSWQHTNHETYKILVQFSKVSTTPDEGAITKQAGTDSEFNLLTLSPKYVYDFKHACKVKF